MPLAWTYRRGFVVSAPVVRAFPAMDGGPIPSKTRPRFFLRDLGLLGNLIGSLSPLPGPVQIRVPPRSNDLCSDDNCQGIETIFQPKRIW